MTIGPPTLDTDLGGKDDLRDGTIYQSNGFTVLRFTRSLLGSDPYDRDIAVERPVLTIFAYHPLNDTDYYYHGDKRGAAYITFLQHIGTRSVLTIL